MQVYLAGVCFALPIGKLEEIIPWFERTGQLYRELDSYIDLSKPGGYAKVMGKVAPFRIELMLDSGAFSAWTKDAVIDIDEYANFILAHPKDFAVVVSLDVIPGKPGRPPKSSKELEKATEQGWEHWKHLTKRLAPIGIKPLPTFHVGENIKWLKKLRDETDYIGLGGMAGGLSTSDRRNWLDEIMPLLVDDKGHAVRKFHGFGMTSVDLMLRYPWHSVDSTSWVLTGRFGSVYVPLGEEIHKVVFSDESPKMKVEGGEHFNTFHPPERRRILEYLESKGFAEVNDKGELLIATDYIRRDEANIAFFLDLEKHWKPQPWRKGDTNELFV